MDALAFHRADLGALAARDRLRALAPRTGIDFASNDYLGLASHPALREAARAAIEEGLPLGSGGSRLLRGNHPEHEALEAEAAAFFGAGAALFFASGFMANTALFATLPQRGDLVVYDALIHASAHDGMRLGRAETVAAAHNDVGAFEDAIRSWRANGGAGRVWIAVESLYSMDGDTAPLADLAALADRHDAMLLIDEAHATGVFGLQGRGLAYALEGRDNVISLHTCGKAMGCEGALILGPAIVREFLVNRARGFVFSTAPSPLMARIARAAIGLLGGADQRRAELRDLIAAAERALGRATGSQIIPVILGEDGPTMRAATALQRQGFDVRGIRPPTVAPGTARLRVSLTLNASLADVERLGTALAEALR